MKKLISTLAALTLLMTAASAQAATILDVSSALAAGDSTQMGRLSRNGIPQDWAGTEPFPGVINTGTSYHYRTFLVPIINTPFVQIDFDDPLTNTFVSAYDTAYLPDSAGSPNFGFNTNWLGDPGLSGNFFGVDPQFFQVIIAVGHTLVVVVNDTTANGAGLNEPFRLTVEGFVDTEFTDPPPAVPEPASMLLTGTGLAYLVRRRRRA